MTAHAAMTFHVLRILLASVLEILAFDAWCGNLHAGDANLL